MIAQRYFACAAFAHLALVVCSACQFNVVPDARFLGSSMKLYMALSGADGYYGFFAPAVDPDLRLRFRLTDKEGREQFVTLTDGATAEANLRLAGIGRLLRTRPDREEQLFRSLAAAMLAKHPQVEAVTIIVESYGTMRPNRIIDFPTMAEWRRGVRPQWQTLHSISLERPKSTTGNATAEEVSPQA